MLGLGSQCYKTIMEINVFQERFSATVLFFYLPCNNEPIFRRSLNPGYKALSPCNLGAIRRIKHQLKCKTICSPCLLVPALPAGGDHSASDTLFVQPLYI